MPTCSAGHHSGSSDFCDTCGTRLGAPTGATLTITAGPPDSPCPRCGNVRAGHFCESCGFDFTGIADGGGRAPYQPDGMAADLAASGHLTGLADPPSGSVPRQAATGTWTAVATADWLHYERVIAGGSAELAAVQFPGYCPERRFRLTGPEMRIGRGSVTRGIDPEIDLTGPPADPGISRLHAVLIGGLSGWSIMDPGSANGTQVNEDEIPLGVPVPLSDGDRIYLGAWTRLVIEES